ncbi:MAG: DUF1330 domain-containing protein [Candidatus Marinimicrobia bacterium]|jgi:uncharacterized protein (DUF1330 family)|nr:DUF1330 domain-containing protein [Candidatus Neomarinimicrobiota bacterium]MBT5224614.1 DUF1330 domain-containing protein [Candidatus Neomarinimicrobiota bacterium]MBT6936728.1 DUF1330 domain-containing protein [Candidatus Neomarinimicrobiota bacterium]MBT6938779.1 DUF1330 domain-containing protein [Candidatus Neomarinimicrobiota bacterium]
MAAYLIANIDVQDSTKYKEYIKLTPPIVQKFGGKFLIRGGDYEICEGEWQPKRIIMIQFKSMEKAKEFYHSIEYKKILQIRQDSSYSDLVLVDGISPEI